MSAAKFLLTAALAVFAMLPWGGASAALRAEPPRTNHNHHHIYSVYYRQHTSLPWQFYGSYRSRLEADSTAFSLRLLNRWETLVR